MVARILSYLKLPTGDSVKTSVLSKRWEFLWLMVSSLDLDVINLSRDGGEALARKHDDSMDDCNKRVMEWIAEVVHGGVQHLDIPCLKYVYVSKTVVSLKLVKVGHEDPKFVVSLPSRKMMHLENILYKNHGVLLIIKMLLSGSPVLEVLTLEFSVPVLTMPRSNFDLVQDYFYSCKPGEIDLTNVPLCMQSTLKYVKINKLITKEESGIKVVNYFLDNSAVLKKLTHSSMEEIQEPESFMKLLTSTKLSRNCQVFIH
ncbi:unnamed protein product [Arabidopsis thaliana]|uniref:FBD domain-containing protein n=1 Tax=Arabidopsis thaliana TaxID=3702 RepID=A0A654EWP7_ARATH|nr:unnamed protein product [Arabidopsis thaliana]